ncbi:hypothetical protein CEK28_03740 [Xenophilus sp. AP218F]|nr:hypothetical protein CEK28_03740 [Xenophilus sp. AP218F]
MSMLATLILDQIEKHPALADVFLDTNCPAGINGALGFEPIEPEVVITSNSLSELLHARYGGDLRPKLKESNGSDDFSLKIGDYDFRAALRSTCAETELSLTLRWIRGSIPHYSSLGLPVEVGDLVYCKNGLVLFTGQTNSGKSTSQMALIDHYNETIAGKIITLEHPIEYRLKRKRSCVNQREIGVDVPDFITGIRDAMRESPTLLMIGEIRDQDTLVAAIQGAESGHLVFASLHTNNFENTVDRVCDLLSGTQAESLRKTFASVLRAVISQQLVPAIDGKRRNLAHEVVVLPANERAIQNMIRKGELQQLGEEINKRRPLMHVLNDSLAEMVMSGQVKREDALAASYDRERLETRISS